MSNSQTNSRKRIDTPNGKRIATSELNKAWREFVREQPYFAKWKKENVRSFWYRDGQVHKGIELQVSKFGAGYALVAHAGIEFDSPLLTMEDVHRDYRSYKGLFCFEKRVDIEGGISVEFAGDWVKGTPEELYSDLEDIAGMLSDFVIPFFDNLNTAFEFTSRMEELFQIPHLPVILEYKGMISTRKALAAMLKDTDHFIIEDKLID